MNKKNDNQRNEQPVVTATNTSRTLLNMAQKEAIRIKEKKYSGGGVRKSKRWASSQRIQTSKLRRIKELFWDHDSLYQQQHSDDSVSSSNVLPQQTLKFDHDDNYDDNLKQSIRTSCLVNEADAYASTNNDTEIYNHDKCSSHDYSIKSVCHCNGNSTDPSLPQSSNNFKHNCHRKRCRTCHESFNDANNNTNANDSTTTGNHIHRNEHVHKPKYSFNFSTRLRLNKIHDSPHIYTIDHFLTENELLYLERKIQIAEKEKLFQQSFVDMDADDGDDDGDDHDCSDANTPDLSSSNHSQSLNTTTSSTSTSISTSTTNTKDTTNYNHTHKTPEKQRTSSFIHFPKLSHSKITSIENRAAELLNLPIHSIEPLQLVRYTPGEYFANHHDMGILYPDGSVGLPTKQVAFYSRRIVTILVYLNDLPNGCGGSTRFPLLSTRMNSSFDDYGPNNDDNIRSNNNNDKEDHINNKLLQNVNMKNNNETLLDIFPKRGLAVIWCNIQKDGMPDARVVHSGQPINIVATNQNDAEIMVSKSDSMPCAKTCHNDLKKYAINIWACET